VGLYNVLNRRQELYRWIDTINSDDTDAFSVRSALSLGRQFQFKYSLQF